MYVYTCIMYVHSYIYPPVQLPVPVKLKVAPSFFIWFTLLHLYIPYPDTQFEVDLYNTYM